jgi:hypothetical protein
MHGRCSGTARLLSVLQHHVIRVYTHEAAAAAVPAAQPPAAGTPPAAAAWPKAQAASAAGAVQNVGAHNALVSWAAIAFMAIAGTAAADADAHKKVLHAVPGTGCTLG